MTTKQIAELTGKRHDNVMRDCQTMFKELELDALTFEDTYKDKANRNKPMFTLPEELVNTLITGYSIKLRHSVIKALQDIRDNAKTLEEAHDIAAIALSTVRESLRTSHKPLCEKIQGSMETLKLHDKFGYNVVMNLACKVTCGVGATVFKRENGVAPRDYWKETASPLLFEYDRNLAKIELMIDMGMDYQEIREVLGVK